VGRETYLIQPSVLIALNYYVPYVSGLTNVARDVAEGLVKRGWDVTVITSQHNSTLPLNDEINGVRVIRTPVLARIGKGVISPGFISAVLKESRRVDLVNIHSPMLEAGLLGLLVSKPLVVTYHCDVSLGASFLSKLQTYLIDLSTKIAVKRAYATIVTSEDYASHSRLCKVLDANKVVIPAPCHFYVGGSPTYRETDGVHIGFLGRIVEEKGVEYLVEGFRQIKDASARLLLAGDFAEIAGGSVIESVKSSIGNDSRIRILGKLDPEDIANFYASLDIFALTSINSFEAFGISQVEAMMSGVPVVATNLPGVRQPILETGMGVIVPPKSSEAITDAIKGIERDKKDWSLHSKRAAHLYSCDHVLGRYEKAFFRAIKND
jgi:glycosyltransferase involved in cell wall biosynthesis